MSLRKWQVSNHVNKHTSTLAVHSPWCAVLGCMLKCKMCSSPFKILPIHSLDGQNLKERALYIPSAFRGHAAKSFGRVWLFATPWTVARQAPLSKGFPRQEYWSGCYFLLQGIFLTQEWNSHLCHLLHCRLILYHLCHLGKPFFSLRDRTWGLKNSNTFIKNHHMYCTETSLM